MLSLNRGVLLGAYSVAFLTTIALATVVAKEVRLADHVRARWYAFAVRSLDPDLTVRYQGDSLSVLWSLVDLTSQHYTTS